MAGKDAMKNLRIDAAGEQVELLPSASLFWPAQKTLFVADVHLGKSAMFRQAGIPTPELLTEVDLNRLSACLKETSAQRLVFLGDLFHGQGAAPSYVDLALRKWRGKHASLHCQLVLGNHDRIAKERYQDWEIEPADSLRLGPFLAKHEPAESENAYVLAGHIHPAARLCAGDESLRLPCFVVGARCCILPAFGSFTGTHVWERSEEDRVYVLSEEEVLPWNPPPQPPKRAARTSR